MAMSNQELETFVKEKRQAKDATRMDDDDTTLLLIARDKAGPLVSPQPIAETAKSPMTEPTMRPKTETAQTATVEEHEETEEEDEIFADVLPILSALLIVALITIIVVLFYLRILPLVLGAAIPAQNNQFNQFLGLSKSQASQGIMDLLLQKLIN
jgi:hypothetical protein